MKEEHQGNTVLLRTYIAPMSLLVDLPYTAPKVKVGEMMVMKSKSETAIVFWLKLIISLSQ